MNYPSIKLWGNKKPTAVWRTLSFNSYKSQDWISQVNSYYMSILEIIPVATGKRWADQPVTGQVPTSGCGTSSQSLLIKREIMGELVHERELLKEKKCQAGRKIAKRQRKSKYATITKGMWSSVFIEAEYFLLLG